MSEQAESKVSGEVQDAGLPKPEFSEQTVSPTSGVSPEVIAELSKSLVPVIEDTIERKFKSTTDKRFSKLEKGTTVMTDILAKLKEQGATIPADVEREYALQDYVNKRIEERVASEPSGNGIPQKPAKTDGQFDALDVVKNFGLDTNDAQVRDLLAGKYRNPDHFKAEAAQLALVKATKPASSSAGSPPLSGGTGTHKLTDVEIAAKYKRLDELYKVPSKNQAEIKSLEKELEMG